MKISISTEIYGKQYTEEQINAFPTFSKRVAETHYRIPAKVPVVVDNQHGLGATPDNQSVLYKGCVATLSIDTFLSLALAFPKGARDEDAATIQSLIEKGYGIGSPCLYLDIDKYVENNATTKPARVVGHEGRARCIALRKLGVSELPVQLLFIGYRARSIENVRDFVDYLQSGIQVQKSTKVVRNALVGTFILEK